MSEVRLSHIALPCNDPLHSTAASTSYALPRPTDCYHYIDHLHFCLREPPTAEELHWYQSKCGSVYVRKGRANFGPATSYSLQLKQPSRAALQRLPTIKDAKITYVEIARDTIYRSETELEVIGCFFDRHNLKRFHRGQEVGFYTGRNGVTRYSSRKRNVRHNLVTYSDLACRKTGELHCFHLEWKAKGAAALRIVGIHNPGDLLRFDHQAFWKKNLLLFDLDLRKLGRQWLNHFENTSRKKPRVKPVGRDLVYDFDLRTGSILFRSAGLTSDLRPSVQVVIDEYKPILKDINRCLTSIATEVLEPPRKGKRKPSLSLL
jgi:hypothetical protein